MSTQNTLIALVAGATLGALAGVLLAPQSGEKTRKKLLKKGEDLRGQLTDLMNQGKKMMDNATDEAKDATDKASKKVHETMSKAKGAYDSAASKA